MFIQETRWSLAALRALIGLNLIVFLSVVAPAVSLPPGHPERTLLLTVAGITAIFLTGITWTFTTLRVTIDEHALTVGFGPFRERVPLERVTACRPTTYRWWDWGGWGIRLGWRAKLYNVPGDGGVAVELTFDDGRRLLFSSSDPAAVCQVLRDRRPEIWEV
jgi:hypothetical protein